MKQYKSKAKRQDVGRMHRAYLIAGSARRYAKRFTGHRAKMRAARLMNRNLRKAVGLPAYPWLEFLTLSAEHAKRANTVRRRMEQRSRENAEIRQREIDEQAYRVAQRLLAKAIGRG